jgi:DNA-directed RNA polymerase delta subunit
MQILKVEDYTYKRLSSVLEDVMHSRRKNLNFDDILNELIDVYQENVWGSIGGQIGGG